MNMNPTNVLIVEDNSDLAFAMKALLRLSGVEAICAADGMAALQMLKRGLPRLVLMDVNMPSRNGLEILTEIRDDPRLADVRVVIYTAIDDADIRREALQLGALAYVVKGSLDAASIADLVSKYAEPASTAHLHANTEAERSSTAV